MMQENGQNINNYCISQIKHQTNVIEIRYTNIKA